MNKAVILCRAVDAWVKRVDNQKQICLGDTLYNNFILSAAVDQYDGWTFVDGPDRMAVLQGSRECVLVDCTGNGIAGIMVSRYSDATEANAELERRKKIRQTS